MWWLRCPTRAAAAGPPCGDLRPGTGAVLVVGFAAVALGIVLPVLGVSLLAFLLVDAHRTAARRSDGDTSRSDRRGAHPRPDRTSRLLVLMTTPEPCWWDEARNPAAGGRVHRAPGPESCGLVIIGAVPELHRCGFRTT